MNRILLNSLSLWERVRVRANPQQQLAIQDSQEANDAIEFGGNRGNPRTLLR